MRAIHTKLFRDIWLTRGAVITIAIVVAAGVAAYVTLRGTWLSMVNMRDRYYSAERFGDLFVHLERAPDTMISRLEALPGVARAYTRVVGPARVPLEHAVRVGPRTGKNASTPPEKLDEPAQALVISIPEHDAPPLNGIVLREGVLPNPERSDEALLVEMFAEKHHVQPGDSLKVVMEGRERMLRVVGLAMSPEFVLSVPNGASAPSPNRFAVLWMPRPAVEAAYDMRGAFNDVVLDLSPDANADDVKTRLDALLESYGGLGSQKRERQISNYFLTQDLALLGVLATMAPIIFLSVAAFLLNVVLSRLVELDRPQIATLKAVGYTNFEVGLHYLQLTMIIAIGGGITGLSFGTWLGGSLTRLYQKFYRMPALEYEVDANLFTGAMVVAILAGLAGAALAVRRVVRLPPAEAMRPVAPPSYRRDGLGSALLHLFTPSARMVAREVMRRPGRLVLGTVGIAAATGIVMIGQFFGDAMVFLFHYYVPKAQSETMAVSFVKPVPTDSLAALRVIEGVRDVQWQSTLAVRVRSKHRDQVVTLIGHPERGDMRPILDSVGTTVPLGRDEVLFTETLAKLLDVKPGESVRIEPMQGERTPRVLTMTGTVDELMGMFIHMPSTKEFALFGDAPNASSAILLVDANRVKAVQAEINDMPQVTSVMRKDLFVAELRKQTGDSIGAFTMVLTLFAVAIALSVVYNNARVALSMRSRELASLRVLGFTRGEISSILISELAVQVLLGIPVGLVLGRFMSVAMVSANDPEAFRFPTGITNHTLAFAALVTACAAVGSALLVRRKLDKLDLIEVLKTRE